jgi:hypothetical protein
MKTIKDFKIKGEAAILEGISYANEAIVVEDFLKANPTIKYVKVVTKDNRNFELKDSKLVFTKEEQFINPYYVNINPINNDKVINNDTNVINNRDKENNLNIEDRIKCLEDKSLKYEKMLKEVAIVLSSITK